MFSFTSLWKKPNTIKIPIQKYTKENFQKNMNGILVKKYYNDSHYKKSIESESDKNNDSLIPFDNDNNIIVVLLASVTSIFFYFYKYLKM